MKSISRIIRFVLILSIFFICNEVYAVDYSIKQLIPVTEEANVVSDTFVYTGIKFETNDKGVANGRLRFRSIANNTDVKISPSFNILLFDASQKNIGYITYCASKDYGSDNSNLYISGKGSSPFQIDVTSRYFGGRETSYKGEVHQSSEIAYYAFYSDNNLCQIGGYTKYIDLTLDEIVGGNVNIDNDKIKDKLKLNELILYLPYLLISLVGLVGYGLLLNCLYKRMKARTSILSYFPMTNFYIAVKLAFGKIIAWLFYILCVISFVVVFTSSDMTFTYISIGFVGLATLVDIIKLITGKYDMLIIGKKKHKDIESDNTFSSNHGTRFIDESEGESTDVNTAVTANDLLNSIDNGINDHSVAEEMTIDENDVVDISYDSDVPISDDGFTSLESNSPSFPTVNDMNNMNSMNDMGSLDDGGLSDFNALTPVSNVSSGDLDDDDNVNNNFNNNTSNTNTTLPPRLGEDQGSGESELSNFFR